MRLEDDITLLTVTKTTDADLNEIETTLSQSLGKCIICPNTSARLTSSEDGQQYIYSYLLIMRKPSVIPTENSRIHIKKKDGTVDKDCTVKGFVTLRNWLKIWV
jgi:hypothetical protein